jgi:hypothetical protein
MNMWRGAILSDQCNDGYHRRVGGGCAGMAAKCKCECPCHEPKVATPKRVKPVSIECCIHESNGE